MMIEETAKTLESEGLNPAEIKTKLRSMLAHSDAFAASVGRAGALDCRMAQIIEGVIKVVPWPWARLTEQCPSLMPGMVTMFAGSPGATKSFAMLQCITWWVSRDYKVGCLMMEGTRGWHLQRALAQMSGNRNMTSIPYVADHPEEVEAAIDKYRYQISQIAEAIDIPASDFTYQDVMAWMQDCAKKGCRIIIVDPITKANPEGRQWEEDRTMVSFANSIAKRHRTSIILVTHPKQTKGMPGFENLAGGSAYSRHVQALIWLATFDAKTLSVETCCGRSDIECNRVMHLLKVTDGLGQNKHIGCLFNKNTLLLEEKGIVVKETKP